MRIRILLFAGVKQRVGKSEIELSLDGKPTVADVRDLVASLHSEVSGLIRASRWAIHDEFVSLLTEVQDGDVLTMVPPVSGG